MQGKHHQVLGYDDDNLLNENINTTKNTNSTRC